MTTNNNSYNPFENMKFSSDECFLCGQILTDNTSVEHVFPKWLQNKYHLWNQKIHLLNGTEIPYRQLTIPCCKKCNGIYLSELEKKIERALENGFESFKELDEMYIFQWVSKLFYGLLYKELSLVADRRNPSLGTIMTPEMLEHFRVVHKFLQSVRTPFDFSDGVPWSIFILETYEYEDNRSFNYIDGIATLTFHIKLNGVAIFVFLQDNGIHKEFHKDYFNKFTGEKLHSAQLNEIMAKIVYGASLMNRVPKYIFTEQEDTNLTSVISLPIQGLTTKPIFDTWIDEDYCRFLEYYLKPWGIAYDNLYFGPGKVITYLFNEDGSFKRFHPDSIIAPFAL
ncbi:hypothetical protein LQV63_25870 [Paenibacillus profundus]|uniref:HNH endonuclease n=1 Tax=Paenibacillus profundus TaxID=1173085 RepID=A0ABS8YQS0_9BACL|nr:hypothetical protein [Paenibacillus profundus]MCE5172701.1 hypothetical protein [Paenibacillus profundus]